MPSHTEQCKQSRSLYVSIAMGGKKITLDKEGISEILVADTDSEPCSEARDFENNFEEEEEEEDQHHHHQQQQQQASTEVETQPATNGGLPTWGPPQGRNTNMHTFLGPAKGVKNVRLQTSTKTAHHCLC